MEHTIQAFEIGDVPGDQGQPVDRGRSRTRSKSPSSPTGGISRNTLFNSSPAPPQAVMISAAKPILARPLEAAQHLSAALASVETTQDSDRSSGELVPHFIRAADQPPYLAALEAEQERPELAVGVELTNPLPQHRDHPQDGSKTLARLRFRSRPQPLQPDPQRQGGGLPAGIANQATRRTRRMRAYGLMGRPSSR